ncbi:hypothetical protein BKA63DRAFT_591397, partial [Paraphoma chrysanthemicola]
LASCSVSGLLEYPPLSANSYCSRSISSVDPHRSAAGSDARDFLTSVALAHNGQATLEIGDYWLSVEVSRGPRQYLGTNEDERSALERTMHIDDQDMTMVATSDEGTDRWNSHSVSHVAVLAVQNPYIVPSRNDSAFSTVDNRQERLSIQFSSSSIPSNRRIDVPDSPNPAPLYIRGIDANGSMLCVLDVPDLIMDDAQSDLRTLPLTDTSHVAV